MGTNISGDQVVQVGSEQVDDNDNIEATLATKIAGEDIVKDVLKTEQRNSTYYVAAAGENNVVKASAGFLHAIIVGKEVAGGIIEVSDHASNGDGNVKICLEDAPVGTIIIDASFAIGICADLTTQTNVTFIYH